MLSLGQYVWKVADRRKNAWCTKTALNLQPSNLCSNAYRSLSGDQDIFSLLFSCGYIHRNPRKWLIILKYFLSNSMNIVLFIKALQHKCWRSLDTRSYSQLKMLSLGQYVWKVADRIKNSCKSDKPMYIYIILNSRTYMHHLFYCLVFHFHSGRILSQHI